MEGTEQIFVTEFAEGYTDDANNTIILKATNDYIPIRNFKQLFGMLSDQVKDSEGKYTKFIFDKTALRTFHQPSMKWYFMEWKTDMLQYGLNTHIKILPKIDYFVKAVEAARKPLLAKFSPLLALPLSFTYFFLLLLLLLLE